MKQENSAFRKLSIGSSGFIVGLTVGLSIYYGGVYLLTYILPVSKILFETIDSIIPLIIELLALAVLVFFGVKINRREKISRKTLFENFSKANLQEFIVVEMLGGIVAGLFFMIMYFMITF